MLLHELICHEGYCLARHDAQQARCDASPERRQPLLAGDDRDALKHPGVLRRLAGHDDLLLQAGLDNIQRVVHEGPHPPAQPTEHQMLHWRKLAAVSKIPAVPLLHGLVRREVDSLVAALAGDGGPHALVERPETLFFHDDIRGLEHIVVLDVRHPQRGVLQRMVLRLHANLAHVRRRHNHDSLGHATHEAGQEDAGLGGVVALRAEEHPELLVAGEAHRHLGHDARHDRGEALVEGQEAFSLHDAEGGRNGSLPRPSRRQHPQLHARLDGIERVAAAGLHQASGASADQVLQKGLPLARRARLWR
mmetsp:Transcript_18787/g.71104  ORF Transcript_18787/g.71104 Transcript_18787/m.71104 type:complete len:306 (+) Transcript_18787:5511-6428(+)|eukprot:scaffold1277_cov253-Pinguiococcus_pyrenoidosus.AAC.43